MVRITIDEELKQKLISSDEIVELVDESGNFVGRLLPQAGFPPEGWEPITPIPSEEELQRRMAYDGPGITTEELIKRLRSKP